MELNSSSACRGNSATQGGNRKGTQPHKKLAKSLQAMMMQEKSLQASKSSQTKSNSSALDRDCKNLLYDKGRLHVFSCQLLTESKFKVQKLM